jgi:hypothetical protein
MVVFAVQDRTRRPHLAATHRTLIPVTHEASQSRAPNAEDAPMALPVPTTRVITIGDRFRSPTLADDRILILHATGRAHSNRPQSFTKNEPLLFHSSAILSQRDSVLYDVPWRLNRLMQ